MSASSKPPSPIGINVGDKVSASSPAKGSTVKFGTQSVVVGEGLKSAKTSSGAPASSGGVNTQAQAAGYANLKAQSIVKGGGKSAYEISEQDRYYLEQSAEGRSLLAAAIRANPAVVSTESSLAGKTTQEVGMSVSAVRNLGLGVTREGHIVEVQPTVTLQTGKVYTQKASAGYFNDEGVQVDKYGRPVTDPFFGSGRTTLSYAEYQEEQARIKQEEKKSLVQVAEEAVKREEQAAQFQKQAEQQLSYEAFQESTKEAQKQALATGQTVQITTESIESKKQELASTKYAEGIPVIDQEAAAEVLRANYAGFKANTIVEAANKGQASAFALSDHDVKALEKAGIPAETAREVQALPASVNEYNAATSKVDEMLAAASEGKSTDVSLTPADVHALEKMGSVGLQDKTGLVVAKPAEINSFIDSVTGKGAPDSGIAESARNVGLLPKSPFYVEQIGRRGTIERVNFATPVYVAPDITKPHNIRQIWAAPKYGPQPKQQLVKDVPATTDFGSDFGKGFGAEAENLGKSIISAGQSLQQIWFREAPRTVRDAEGEVVYTNKLQAPEYKPGVGTDLSGLGILAATELASTGKTQVQWTDLQKVGENFVKNPAYAIGNVAFEAMTFFGPGAATKGAKVVQAVKLATDVKQIERALSPIGNAARVEKDLISFGTEVDPYRYAVGRYSRAGGKPEVELFTRQMITSAKEAIVPPSRLTVYTRPAIEIGKRGSEQLIDIGKLPKDIPEAFPLARKGSNYFERFEAIQGRGEVYQKLPVSEKAVQTSERYTAKQLKETLATDEGIKKFMGIDAEKIGFRPGKGAGGAGTSKGALAVDFVQELQKAEKAVAKATSKSSGALSMAGIIGAGAILGITGSAEASAKEQQKLAKSLSPVPRTRSKKDDLTDFDAYLRVPAGFVQHTFGGFSSADYKNLQKDLSSVGGRFDTSQSTRQFDTTKMLDNFRLDTPQNVSTGITTDNLTGLSQAVMPMQGTNLQEQQLNVQQVIPRFDVPNMRFTYREFPFFLPDQPGQKRKRRRGEESLTYFERRYEVPDILEVTFGAKQGKALPGFGFDDWGDFLNDWDFSKKGKKGKRSKRRR